MKLISVLLALDYLNRQINKKLIKVPKVANLITPIHNVNNVVLVNDDYILCHEAPLEAVMTTKKMVHRLTESCCNGHVLR